MCYSPFVPQAHYTDGVAEADYILYVTARPTTESTLAWALSCFRDQIFRPIGGQSNFGPSHLSDTARDRGRQLNTAIHELAHALGFSNSDFPYFVDSKGDRLGMTKVVKSFFEREHTVNKLITPASSSKAKEHVGCDNMNNPGIEIEDSGGSGSAGSHLEKRTYNNEVMTSSIGTTAVKSDVMLAVFQDMGWYQVSFTLAEYLAWGKSQGCNFLSQKCDAWNTDYFCTQDSKPGCTVDRKEKGYCTLTQFSGNLPSQFQYFADSTRGADRAT